MLANLLKFTKGLLCLQTIMTRCRSPQVQLIKPEAVRCQCCKRGRRRVTIKPMTEATAARAHASPAGERPRISAASFRNLTARLKKVDAATPIPDVIPEIMVQPVAAPPGVDFAPPPTPHADPVQKPKLHRIQKV